MQCNQVHIYDVHLRLLYVFFFLFQRPPISTLFPYTTLFRSLVMITLIEVGVFYVPAFQGVLVPVLLVLRSEEHTSELQSLTNLVCRLLLEKKNTVVILALMS